MPDYGKSLTPIQITDVAIKESVYRALWEDSVLRALEYYELDVDVKNGIVTLYGHIVGSSNQSRIRNAIQGIPGIVEIKNNLLLDDMLTLTIF